MAIVSLRDFIAIGAFGPLRLGATRDDVKTAFGAPPLWGMESDCERVSLWKYGDFEFHFDERGLQMIFAEYFEVPCGDGSLQIAPWIVCRSLTMADAEQAFQAAGIGCHHAPAPDPDGISLICRSGVVLSFSSQQLRSIALHRP